MFAHIIQWTTTSARTTTNKSIPFRFSLSGDAIPVFYQDYTYFRNVYKCPFLFHLFALYFPFPYFPIPSGSILVFSSVNV